MVEENKTESRCLSADREMSCCQVEAVISVDDRGQMVLPKESRETAKNSPWRKISRDQLGKRWGGLLYFFS